MTKHSRLLHSPFLRASIGILCALVSKDVDAQPNTTAPATAGADVGDLFNAGVQAADKAQWAAAITSFSAAWGLSQHFRIAGALGRAELMDHRYRDAAEHLEVALRTGRAEMDPENIKALEEWYADARTHVTTITVRANVAASLILIDEREVATSPLTNPLFVNPGSHRISARHDGYETTETLITTVPGRSYDVPIDLAPRTHTTTLPPPPAGTAETSKRPPMSPVIIGGILGSAGVITGLVSVAVSNSKAADAEALGKNIEKCPRDPECAELTRLRDDQDLFGTIAVGSLLVGGALVVGTAVYYAVAKTRSDDKIGIVVTPFITPQGGAVTTTIVF